MSAVLEKFAADIRIHTLKCLGELGFGHIGGAMSIIETLAVLYGEAMNIDPTNPDWKDRDYLVVSKGHAGPAVYATLALKGYFPLENLKTLNKPGTTLPSHCDRLKTIGIDMTTGSLGQGISPAIGIALGNRLDGRSSYVYLIVGDGECDEGQIWEGALFAAHYKLDHLIMFVDNNKQQLDGFVKDVLDTGDFKAKFESFGWFAQKVNGHDTVAISTAIQTAKKNMGRPAVIILDTVKGYGCPFAAGLVGNHHMTFTKEQIDDAVKSIKTSL